MTVRSLMLVAAVLTHQLHAKVARRNLDTGSCKDQYKYVVALFKEYRRCTGTLISPNWVVTAAHCLTAVTHIQYGDMTIPVNETKFYQKVTLKERPPASTILEPDLGLIYVESVPMDQYGQLSAVDYKAMIGHSIEYASFGFTKENEGKVQNQDCPLKLTEAVVSLCNEDEKSAFVPYLCVASKCSDKTQQTPPNEPGSPLFHAGKLAGVHIGTKLNENKKSVDQKLQQSYTPVSPYLTWIQRVVNKGEGISRRNFVKTYVPSEYQYRRLQDFSKYLQGLKTRLLSYKDKVLSPLSQGKYQKRDAGDPRRS